MPTRAAQTAPTISATPSELAPPDGGTGDGAAAPGCRSPAAATKPIVSTGPSTCWLPGVSVPSDAAHAEPSADAITACVVAWTFGGSGYTTIVSIGLAGASIVRPLGSYVASTRYTLPTIASGGSAGSTLSAAIGVIVMCT